MKNRRFTQNRERILLEGTGIPYPGVLGSDFFLQIPKPDLGPYSLLSIHCLQ
jgi:hypothetical protein